VAARSCRAPSSIATSHFAGDPYCTFLVHKQRLAALLDTGANVSLISYCCLQTVNILLEPSPVDIALCAADGRPIASSNIVGVARLPFSIGDREFNHTFFVLSETSHDLIVGLDFLLRIDAVLDFRNRRLSSGNVVFPISVVANSRPRWASVCVDARPPVSIAVETSLPPDLCDLVSRSTRDLEASAANAVRQLLLEYRSVFSDSEMGAKISQPVVIESTNTKPVSVPRRYMGPLKKQQLRQHIDFLSSRGLVEPSDSAYACCPVIVPKPSEADPHGTRFTVDFRPINKHLPNRYCVPPLWEDVVENLHGAKYWCRLDLRQAFHQLPLAECSRDLTSFYGPDGTKWRYKCLPMGLSVSPAVLQKCMQEEILVGLVGTILVVYQDDCLVWGESIEELLARLRKVLERFRKFCISVSAPKCDLMQRELKFLGRRLSNDGVSIDNSRIDSIRNFPRPTTRTEVRSFLSTCGFLRQHIADMSTLIEPLSALTSVNKPFVWSDKCEQSFVTLKAAFESPPVLAFPDFTLPFKLMCDASDVGLGALLFQTQGGIDRLIAAHSRLLSPAERNYTVMEKECLAIVFACDHFREYLLGAPFLVETDHQALLWLQSLKEPSKRMWRWIEKLSDFQFSIIHRPGRLNYADSLSRAVPQAPSSYQIDNNRCSSISVSSISIVDDFRLDPAELKADQLADPDLGVVLRHLTLGEPLPDNLNATATAFYRDHGEFVSIDAEGVAYTTLFDRLFPRRCVILPSKHIAHVLAVAHGAPVCGHLGRLKTLSRVRDYFWFPRCYSETRQFCRNCTVCAKRKATNQSTTVPLVPLRHEDAPFALVAMDVVGPINPASSHGHRWILTFHDAFSKLLVAYPLRSTKAPTIVAHLHRYVTDFEVPDALLTDRGTNVDSSLVKSFCDSFGIRKLRTSAYNPRGNSLVERSHRVMSDIIATCLDDSNPRAWDEALLNALRAYKTSQHEATGVSAHELVFGYPAKTPLKLLAGPNAGPLDTPSGSHKEQVTAKQQRISSLWQQASAGLDKAQSHRRKLNDQKANHSRFAVGDSVGIVIEDTDGKFGDRYTGPYLVRQVNNDINDYLVSPPGEPDSTLPWVNRRKLIAFPAAPDVIEAVPAQPVDIAPVEPRARPPEEGKGTKRLRPRATLRKPNRPGMVSIGLLSQFVRSIARSHRLY
jgi:transposase InsO family protein